MPGARAYDLTLLAQNLPLQPLVEFARRVKKNVPADIIADRQTGRQCHPAAHGHSPATGPVWQGGGEVLALNVRSPLTNTRLALDKIPFTVSSSDDLEMRT